MNDTFGGIEVVTDFVNTTYMGAGWDKLGSPEELIAWLSEHSLIESGAQADESDLERSKELREALRALCLANAEGELDAAVPGVLDTAARRAGLSLRFDEHGQAALTPSAKGVNGAHGRLLAIVADSMRTGNWGRLKVCRADDCRWAFYDESKNHSRTWCSMAECGNRAKARSFRERHANA